MEQEDYGYGKTVEEMQKEDEMLAFAYNNSYMMLTNKVTMDYVLDASESEFENMILFFIETEEYEKCAVIKKMLNKDYPESVNETLDEWL